MRKAQLLMMTCRGSLCRGVSWSIFFFLGAAIMVLGMKSPYITHDTLMYHAPFGARLAHISGAENYHILPHLNPILDGFPRLPFYIYGLLLKITESYSSLTLISSVPLLVCCGYTAFLLNLNPVILLLTFFAFPLVAFHAKGSFYDLLGAAFLMVQMTTVVWAHQETRKSEPRLGRVFLALLFINVLTFCIGQIKIFVIPPSILLCMVLTLVLVSGNLSGRAKAAAILLCISSVALLHVKCLVNFMEFGNPFYPIKFYKFDGPMPEYRDYPLYWDKFGLLKRPVGFLLSITEIDWIIRNVKWMYSIDGFHVVSNGPGRTGGFGAFWLLFLSFFVVDWRARGGWGRMQPTFRFFVFVFILLLAFTSLMPQSHELRYWLYLPLVGGTLCAGIWHGSGLFARSLYVAAALSSFCLGQVWYPGPNTNYMGRGQSWFHYEEFTPQAMAPEYDKVRVIAAEKGEVWLDYNSFKPFFMLYSPLFAEKPSWDVHIANRQGLVKGSLHYRGGRLYALTNVLTEEPNIPVEEKKIRVLYQNSRGFYVKVPDTVRLENIEVSGEAIFDVQAYLPTTCREGVRFTVTVIDGGVPEILLSKEVNEEKKPLRLFAPLSKYGGKTVTLILETTSPKGTMLPNEVVWFEPMILTRAS